MKKLIASCLVIAMLAVSLCACVVKTETASTPSSNSSQPESKTSVQSSDVSSQPESSSDVSVATSSTPSSSADLFSWNIKFDGHDYTIPCDYKEFEKNGWKLREGENETLNANTYTLTAYLEKDGKSISIQLWNPSKSPVKYSEAKVGSIEVGLDDKVSIELPGGFVFDESVTVADIKAKYGETDEGTKGDNYETVEYEQDIYSDVRFFIYNDDKMKKYSNVEIQNFI